MTAFLDVQTIFVTILGYPLSYIEFFGTLGNVFSVWLLAKKNTLNWPIGILATILFVFLFYQIRLYADLLEQLYFLVTGIWGWWMWTRISEGTTKPDRKITYLPNKQRVTTLVAVCVTTVVLWILTRNLNTLFPELFTAPALYPLIDSFTTAMSFVATILLVYKKVEAWYFWLVVDVIGIWLYQAAGASFVSVLYVVFLFLALQGLLSWRSEARNSIT